MSNRKFAKHEKGEGVAQSESLIAVATHAAAQDSDRLQAHANALADIRAKLEVGFNDLIEAETVTAAVAAMAAKVLDERNEISKALSGLPMGEAFLARNRVLTEYDNLRWQIAEMHSSIRRKAEGLRLLHEVNQRAEEQKRANENQRLLNVARDLLRNPNSVDPNTRLPWTSDGVDALVKGLQAIADQQAEKMNAAVAIGQDPLAENAEVDAARETYTAADQERKRITALVERLLERREALIAAENSPERAKQYAEAVAERDACIQLIQADYRSLIRDLKALLARVDRCNQMVAAANQNRPKSAEFLLRPEHVARKVNCGTAGGPASILSCRLVDIDGLN